MKVGDIVCFWDYGGGAGFVEGLVVELSDHQYSSTSKACPSVHVLYHGTIQVVPINDGHGIKVVKVRD